MRERERERERERVRFVIFASSYGLIFLIFFEWDVTSQTNIVQTVRHLASSNRINITFNKARIDCLFGNLTEFLQIPNKHPNNTTD